jgi:hypothetical protein
VSAWGINEFGDPCRACGFDWSIPIDDARAEVTNAPADFAKRFADVDGNRRHPDLDWNVTGYICHVGDSIRIWSERIATIALGTGAPVAPYSQTRLAEARHCDEIELPAALWSLERATGDWQAALDLAGSHNNFAMPHEEMGTMSLEDVIRIRAHDVFHHTWDIERTLAG